ncbi:MAG: YicC family protein [Bradymonadia bacterium]
MAYSMTGYGTAKSTVDGVDVEVQVKSLNHRSLDIHVNMPTMPGQMELLFQRLVRQFVSRGRIDLTVLIGDERKARAGLNSALLEARVATLGSLFNGAWTRNKCLEFCLAQRDVWEFEQSPVMGDAFYEGVLETARLALEVLTKARRAEGRALESYLLNALDEIDTSHRAALARAPERVSEFRQALTERLSVLKESSVEVDSVRLATEVALLADRIDVTEELTRIATHLSALRFLIQQPSDPLVCLGKKIDFYLQELNREATTMASKSRDTILTRHTIDIRTTIESIREQAANIQ